MSKKRFYISTKGNDDNAYLEAMKYACMLADQDKEIQQIILFIYTKTNTGWFNRLFGHDIVRQLFKGTTFFDNKNIFKLETVNTYKDGYTPSEIVISCGLDAEHVLKIDDYDSVKAIIAIPWQIERLEKWIQTWDPIEIRGNEKVVAKYHDPSCIVKKAMKSLTDSINMSTGINHYSDNYLAKTYILALKKYEPSLDANILGAYLVRELHWETEHAKDIVKLINTLNEGRYFKGGSRTGLKEYYNSWKEECK